ILVLSSSPLTFCDLKKLRFSHTAFGYKKMSTKVLPALLKIDADRNVVNRISVKTAAVIRPAYVITKGQAKYDGTQTKAGAHQYITFVDRNFYGATLSGYFFGRLFA